MDNLYDLALQNAMNKLDSLTLQCENEMALWGNIDTDAIKKSASSLDAWDYCFSITFGISSAKITTSEQFKAYLNDIHYAASGASGDYSNILEFLGSLLRHEGDAIDIPVTEKHFINRAYENADPLYHRLLWGHDIFNLREDNPFKLMLDQQGLSGILQAIRHLIADTTSRQGLPLPGSSYLDYVNEEGKVTNYLIDIAKKLSTDSFGNMRNAQSIYSHMFTIRAQDIVCGGAIGAFCAMYFKIRNIQDPIRRVQFRLIAYAVAFFGEAILGALRQNGVPYINIPLVTVVFKNLAQLYYFSIKETRHLHDKTYELIAQADILSDCVIATGEGLVSYGDAHVYFSELSQGQSNVDSLIEDFERRHS